MKPLRYSRRIIPFSVYRKLSPSERIALDAKVKPPMYLTPSDEKPTSSEAPVVYKLQEVEASSASNPETDVAPKKLLMGFREWCERVHSKKTT